VVAVAQLVESRIVIPVVVGSSPIGHPKKTGSSPLRGDAAFINTRLNTINYSIPTAMG
jgi:hypothetical protein